MTKIPKKLSGIDYGEINIANIVITLNEIIDYLEANQTKENKSYKTYKAASSVCCDSSFRLEGDTKEGTMFHVCNNCNKACDIKLTEKKVKASKGECTVVGCEEPMPHLHDFRKCRNPEPHKFGSLPCCEGLSRSESKGEFERGFDEGEKFGRISEKMFPEDKVDRITNNI